MTMRCAPHPAPPRTANADLQYKNVRADYLGALWNVINWGNVESRLVCVPLSACVLICARAASLDTGGAMKHDVCQLYSCRMP